MKVLKHGKWFNDYIVYCKNCNCKIEFSKKDIQTSFLLDETYIICPECKHKIYFDLNSEN